MVDRKIDKRGLGRGLSALMADVALAPDSPAPALGPDAYRALTEVMPVNESPSGWQNDDPGKQVGEGHQGSAFLSGWYGQVSKDVRGVLGEQVPGGFGEPLCGDGDLGACRESLLDSLARADEVPAAQTYRGDAD